MTELHNVLEHVETAEDLFELLELPYNPDVLRVHRLHILKRFGDAVAQIERQVVAGDDPCDRRSQYSAALKRAHDYYEKGPPAGTHAFSGVRRGLVQLGTKGLAK